MSASLAPTDPTRTMRATVRVTSVLAFFLVVYGLALPDSVEPGYWYATGAAGVLALAGSGRAWQFREGRPWWLLYAFAAPGVALMSWFVIAVAPGPVALWLPLWAIHAVNGAFSLPRLGQVLFHAMGMVSLAIVLVARNAGLDVIVLDLGLYLVLAFSVMRMAERLVDTLHNQRTGRADAEVRLELLKALGRMNELDVGRVGAASVEGLARLGYELCTLGVVDPTRGVLEPVASVGFDDEDLAARPIALGDGLAGEAVARRRTVFVDDYQTWAGRLEGRGEVRGAVAVPILVDGEVRGVLQGARRIAGTPGPADVEVLEVLAAQATRVLGNVARFDDERRTGERLRDLDRMKSDFISSVSHELRTPLTVILGAGQTLRRRAAQLSPDQRALLLDRLNANAERLDRLIGALLEMSRLEAGAVPVQLQVVELGPMIERVLSSVGPLAEGHRLEVDHPDVHVHADPSLLEHVMSSLVGNAVKHTPAGTRVRVTASVCDGEVTIEVSDDGPGIAPDERPFVLDQFFRGGPSTRRESSGLGLGLAVASRILTQHGTDLAVADGAGGASFRFRLPLSRPDVLPLTPPGRPAAP